MKKISLTALTALFAFGAVNTSSRAMSITSQFSSQGVNKVIHRSGEVEEDTIANAIVTRADVPVSFQNDETYPWTIQGDYVENGNRNKTYSSSSLQMSFNNTKMAELKFDWFKYRYYSGGLDLQLYIDGVKVNNTTNSSWNTCRHYLQPGEHVVVFRDTIGSDSYKTYSGIRDIRLREIAPLENAVLTEKSEPLTFVNEGTWPWTIEDGYIQNSNYGTANSSSRFTTTFTINQTSKLSYEVAIPNYDTYWTGSSYSPCHDLYININEVRWDYWEAKRDWTLDRIVLEPGTYTVEFLDTIRNTTSAYFARLRNIELTSNWIDVELASAGTLGRDVLYKANVLNDVEMLKVAGPINDTDWATIKQMKNLCAIDLSEATFETLPNNAFDGMTWLGSVILPEEIKSIGEYAFQGTRIKHINIPSTVTSIGQYAFANTRLEYINFAEGSQLTSIGYRAFYQCTSLEELLMPNTVTSVGVSAFNGCTKLRKLVFSDMLTTINRYVCSDCNQLEEVHLPNNLESILYSAFSNTYNLHQIDFPTSLNKIGYNAFYNCAVESVKLPVTLTYLGEYAFQNCFNLKYLEMPSYLENTSEYDYDVSNRYYYGYRSNFYNCDAIETIVCRSATPPVITDDPFSEGRAKSAITLQVPSFAVVDYKLDSYWYQFGNIVEGDDIDFWKITSSLSLTNNRRMQGKPDIDLYYGGQFTVGGNAPMEIGQFNYYVSESNPGRLLNTCEAMTADSINTYFSVSSGTWYFFTPIHDVDLTKVSVSNNASYVFRYYDGSSRATNGTGNSWRNVDNGKLTAGQGYIFHCNANAIITFPAEANVHSQVFNTADVTKQLNAYEAAASANKSWNYVGNPYPCYYDIYYMDFTAPITVWTGSTYKAYSIVDDSYALRPMQSFFVQKPDAVDNIVFHKEGRQLTTSINHTTAANARRAAASKKRYFFDLSLISDEMEDETRIVVNNEASLDYEIECDASKFLSFESAVPQIYTLDAQGNGYAINERPMDDGKVKLAYYAGQAGFFTISANRADGEIYLYDALTNKTVNLMEQDYTFHSDATEGTNTSRFIISLNPDDETGINVIENKQEDGSIYDLQGRKVQNAYKGIFIQNGQKVVRK